MESENAALSVPTGREVIDEDAFDAVRDDGVPIVVRVTQLNKLTPGCGNPRS